MRPLMASLGCGLGRRGSLPWSVCRKPPSWLLVQCWYYGRLWRPSWVWGMAQHRVAVGTAARCALCAAAGPFGEPGKHGAP